MGSRLYDVNILNDGAQSQAKILLAFADFNGDTFTDLITTDNKRQGVFINIWDQNTYLFNQVQIYSMPYALTFAGIIISNVVPDFDYDGKLDFMIYLQNDTYISHKIYFQKTCGSASSCIFEQ